MTAKNGDSSLVSHQSTFRRYAGKCYQATIFNFFAVFDVPLHR